jgi:thioredoxin 1
MHPISNIHPTLLEDLMSDTIHVSDQSFESAVLKSPLPVLVDFWAPWCLPCKMVAPSLEKLAKEYAGRLIVAKVNTDENQEWAMRYHVQGIPTLLLVQDGKIRKTQVGVVPYSMIKEMVDRLLVVQ